MSVSHLSNSAHRDNDWIGGAIKHPGGLHKALHIPSGDKIPKDKMSKALHSDNKHIKRMADLAKTMEGFKK